MPLTPISLLDTVEKILLSRIMAEINSRGLLRDEQFGFRPGLSTTLQLARLVERVKINLTVNRFTGAVLIDVAKVFNSVWNEGILEFPSYLVKVIISYLHSRTFVAAFQAATSSCRLMKARVAQGK